MFGGGALTLVLFHSNDGWNRDQYPGSGRYRSPGVTVGCALVVHWCWSHARPDMRHGSFSFLPRAYPVIACYCRIWRA